MKIKYNKYFKLNDVLSIEEPFMPTTEEDEDIYYSDNNNQEVEISDKDIEFFYTFWHDELHGNCYGNEHPLLYAFKIFFDTLIDDQRYDYRELSKAYGDERLCWSIITHLHQLDLIEWGTSIRFGFLNTCRWVDGALKTDNTVERLRDMFRKYSVDALYQIIHLEEEYDRDNDVRYFVQNND